MDAEVEITESESRAAGTASDYPAIDSDTTSSSSSPVKLPPRLRRRLLESNKSPSITVEEIEAKLKDADLRRQKFYELLSSKARSKPRSPSWSALQEEYEGQRLQAKLRKRESLHESSGGNLKMMVEPGEILSRKLARCWRRFVKMKGTTLSLAKAYVALEINENSVKSMSFEKLALRIESATTLRTVKPLLGRFESCITLKRDAPGTGNLFSLVNIDHLLKHVASPTQKGNISNATNSRMKNIGSTRKVACSPHKLSRYPVRVVLCAYMILGHPNAVFSGKGEHEIAVSEAAESFIREFELLIKIIFNGPIGTAKEETASSSPSIVNFNRQLEAFDKAWCSYLYRFVVWKVKDAKLLEEDLMRASCHPALSMMQTCKPIPEGDNVGLRAIQMQVSEYQKLSGEKVQHLSGSAGLEHMERALSGDQNLDRKWNVQSNFVEAKETSSLMSSPNAHEYFPSSLGSTDGSIVHVTDEISSLAEGCDRTGSVVQFLFKADDSSQYNKIDSSTSRSSADGYWSSGSTLPMDNEVLVNEIVHEQPHAFADGLGTSYEDQQSIKARVRATMERAFWDGIMETMKQDEPDYSWVLKLMKEVQDELCEISPSSWRQEIVETIDVDILAQVMKSGILDMDYFGKILEFALVTLQKLSAPANEDEMKTTHQKLLKELGEISQDGDKSNASLAVLMIKGLRFVLQQIQALKKEISKARIRMLTPYIKGPAGLEYLKKSFTNHYGSPTSAPASLPLTARWLSSVKVDAKLEWDEHVDSLSALSTSDLRCSQGLPPTTLRTGGSSMMTSTIGAPTSIATGLEQPECKGEKVDLLLRLGLLKLVSEVEGLTMENLPETLKLNLLRLLTVQCQLQKITVISTSILILRQTLFSENLVTSPVDMENIVSQSIKQLSDLLDSVKDVGISEIVETLIVFSEGGDPQKLQARKEVMANTLKKSLEDGGAVFTRVSRTVYLAARRIVLGGTAVKGRQLAEGALKRVGAAVLTDTLVEAVKVLIAVATVSGSVHGAWYAELLRHI